MQKFYPQMEKSDDLVCQMKDFQIDTFNKDNYEKVRLENISKDYISKRIRTFGWVSTSRAGKKFSFFDLTSAFKTIKCVVSTNALFTFNTSLIIYGEVKKNESTKDSHEFEISVEKFEIYNHVLAPSFPLNAHSEKDSRLDYGHLALRMKDRALFLKARSALLKINREFYWDNNYYTEITPPTMVQTQVEGGSSLFKLDYYGENAYLTQSSQLYLETVAPVVGAAFCIMPSYRAEKSRSCRHLSEYTHVEAELVDIEFTDLMDAIESLIKVSIKKFYELMLPTIKAVFPDFELVYISYKPFTRLSYKDAIKFLIEKKHNKTDGTPYEMGDDIADASERFLVAEYADNQPIFLINFPKSFKP